MRSSQLLQLYTYTSPKTIGASLQVASALGRSRVHYTLESQGKLPALITCGEPTSGGTTVRRCPQTVCAARWPADE